MRDEQAEPPRGKEIMIQCFFIPIQDRGGVGEAVNKFLAAKCVVNIDKEFAQNGGNSGRSLCIEYLDEMPKSTPTSKSKIDCREVLSQAEFNVYAKIRSLRKEISGKERIPAYAVFNNQQLAAMVEQRITTEQGLREISDIGDFRIKKYGGAFLRVLQVEIPVLSSINQGNNNETERN